MKNYQKGFVVPLLITIIAVLIIGGGIYYYSQNKQVEQKSDVQSNTSIPSNNPVVTTPVSPISTVVSTSIPSVMKMEDYRIRKVPVNSTLPNTIRFQFYGPQQVIGSNLKENDTKVYSTIFPPCRGRKCNATNNELRLDLAMQGRSPVDQPLLSLPLTQVKKEYDEYLKNKGTNGFISSVITVKLPVPPPRVGFAESEGWETWIGSVYYDTDADKMFNPLIDWEIRSTDEYRYAWPDMSAAAKSDLVLGWNYWNASEANDQAHRKSFENSIFQIPVLTAAIN